MYLPMPGQSTTTADFFNPLVRHIETLVLDGRAPYPVERTLLTSGMVIGGVESLFRGQVPGGHAGNGGPLRSTTGITVPAGIGRAAMKDKP